ncbi:unnamed protein product [Kuraishia capsulata CBS 1993]|uniref:non-specific serine/threonine protein kinase n=1 Tax=Kuraishia capsulata CBS 1993 TaxID=1382522 RepID=W6MMC0_9ASCO|nr:uncharacterized protein KUCA_T00003326001 [Kuraishia capsulata CBS 1993]CDK27348.1 unnamed protein product [Kuraishia capsulata CBS 1993]
MSQQGSSNSGGVTPQNQQQQQQPSSSASSTHATDPNIIAKHYKIDKKIGEGSFGIIFKGYDIRNHNLPVAIKFESRKSEAPQLKDEFKAYTILNTSVDSSLKNHEAQSQFLSLSGIPKLYYYGQEGYYNILIIQLLGPSLEDLFDWCGRRFSPKTVAQVAKQMICRIQFVHENNLIYRDIKPDNFLVGDNDNIIYLVDFGMIKQYRNPVTKAHIPYREKKSLSGTARYMSINTHLGREQSRRDDLESLGHVFLYFLKGELPWQGLKAPSNKLKYEKIGEKKRSTGIEDLCAGLPHQFANYLKYVRGLRFDETPDYRYLTDLMDEVLTDLGTTDDGNYDWMQLNNGKGWNWQTNKKTNLNGYGSNNAQNNQNQPQNQKYPKRHSRSHRPGSPGAGSQGRQQQLMSSNYVQYGASGNSRPSANPGAPGMNPVNDRGRINYEDEDDSASRGFFQRVFCCCL